MAIKEFDESKHFLGVHEMDETHEEFLDIYNSMDIDSRQSISKVSFELYEHTRIHFRNEEKLMDRYNYPRSREHKDEHARVLAELGFFIDKSNTVFGANMLKSYLVEKMPGWFDLHLISMDSDLAAHLKNFYMKKEKELEAN